MTLLGPRPRTDLPSALQDFDRFLSDSGSRRPAMFLDYDGVLTPIVAHPDLAILSPETRAVLEDLASKTEIAVISGRDTADVMDKVGFPNLYVDPSSTFETRDAAGKMRRISTPAALRKGVGSSPPMKTKTWSAGSPTESRPSRINST